jgi:hypothetical protein
MSVGVLHEVTSALGISGNLLQAIKALERQARLDDEIIPLSVNWCWGSSRGLQFSGSRQQGVEKGAILSYHVC